MIPEKSPKSPISKSNDPLSILIKKRGIIRGRLTVLTKQINSLDQNSLVSCTNKRAELELRLSTASKMFDEFSEIQSEIELSVNDHDLFQQLELREGFESAYYTIIAQAKSLLSSGEVAPSSHPGSHAVKLPTIAMPTFDGSYEHWLEYRDTFLSLVHNNADITPIQKFHYLKSSLKSVAALVIDSLEFSSNNYTVAWDLICNRYNNTRLLVHNHVKALFSIQNLVKESPTHIRKLIDTILKNLRALKLLNEPVETWDTLIIYMVVCKLDSTTEREWEQYRSSIPAVSSGDTSKQTTPAVKVDNLITFLKNRADMLETLLVTHSTNNKAYKQVPTSKVHCHVSPVSLTTNSSQQQYKKPRACLLCENYHPLYTCQSFIDFNLQKKLKFVQDNNLCPNCLRPGHSVSNCRFGSCRKCNKRHHTMIHADQSVAAAATISSDNKPVSLSVNNSSDANAVASYTYAHTSHLDIRSEQLTSVNLVLLSTAQVEIVSNDGKRHIARALLDCGSERCFITKRLCDLLSIPTIQSTTHIKGVGNSITHSAQSCEVEIKAIAGTFITRLQCFVLPEITSSLPPVSIQSELLQLPNNIQLADAHFNESQQIDILIGADMFWDLLTEGKMRLQNGPFLQNTKLGWIISGLMHSNNSKCDNLIHCNFTQAIDNQLKMFLELEELPKANLLSDDEIACEEHFIKNTMRTADGRFCVKIPLKRSPDILGDTYTIAEQQFLSLEKRLQGNPLFKKKNIYTQSS